MRKHLHEKMHKAAEEARQKFVKENKDAGIDLPPILDDTKEVKIEVRCEALMPCNRPPSLPLNPFPIYPPGSFNACVPHIYACNTNAGKVG